MPSIGEVTGLLELKNEFSARMEQAASDLERAGSRMQQMGDRMASAGTKLTAAVSLPIIGVGAAALRMATDAVEAENLFEVSFGEMSDHAREWSEETGKALGLNRVELRKSAGVIFTMVESMGLGKDAALDMATGITELSGDMASFFNLNPEEAFQKLRSGIVGETEPLRQLGILVDETTVKAVAYKNGIAAVGEQLTQTQKVQARWLAIQEQTVKVQGDLARTLESPANRLRALKTRMEETAITLGTTLMPLFQRFLTLAEKGAERLQSLAEWFDDLSPALQNVVIAFGAFAAVLGPLLFVIGKLIVLAGSAATAIAGMGNSALVASGKLSTLKTVASRLSLVLAPLAVLFTAISQQTEQVEVAAAALRLEYDKGLKTVDDFKARIEALSKVPLKETSIEQRAEMQALRKTLEELAEESKLTVVAVERFSGEVEGTGLSVEALDDAIRSTLGPLEDLGDEAKATAATIEDVAEATEQVETAMSDAAIATEFMTRWLADLEGGSQEATNAQQGLEEQLDDTSEATVNLAQSFADAIAQMIVGAKSLGDALRSLFEGLARQVVTSFVSDFVAGFQKARDASEGVIASVVSGWKQAKEQLAGVAAGIASGFAAASGQIEGLLTGAMSAAVNFAQKNWVAGTAAAIGVVIGLFKKFKKESRDILLETLKVWDVQLSEGLIRRLRELAKVTGDVNAALRAGLLDILEEIGVAGVGVSRIIAQVALLWGDVAQGITSTRAAINIMGQAFGQMFEEFSDVEGTLAEFNRAAAQMVLVMERVTAGELDAAEAARLLDLSFEQMVSAAMEFGLAGAAAVASVVDALREAGVESEAVTRALRSTMDEALAILSARSQMLVDQSMAIVAGIEQMLSGAGAATRREVEFAATAILQAFAGMREAGVPLSHILEELGRAFELLQEQGSSVGASLPEEFARLGEMMEILANERLQNVITRLEGMGAAASAAGAMGLLTAEQFDAFGDRVRNAFRQLVRSGLTAEEALAALGPQLQMLQDLAQQHGFELDANTQRLLDQAQAQGLVADKGLTTEDILIRGFDRMLLALNALIEALGGVPLVFSDWTDAGEDMAEELEQDMQDLEDEIGVPGGGGILGRLNDNMLKVADNTRDAWAGVARDIPELIEQMARKMAEDLDGIPVSFTITGEDGSGAVSAQHGTGGFVDFGAGTPAILHGQEQVVTAAEGVGIAQMVAAAIGGGRRGPDPQLAAIEESIGVLSQSLLRQQAELHIATRDRFAKGLN